MENNMTDPATLIEAIAYFQSEDAAVAFAAKNRWPEGVTCPHCGCKNVGFVKTRRIWNCKNKDCGEQFSVKVGTVMEDSPIPVGKWLVVMWLAANAKNSVSSYELHRAIGVTQKSAWFMLHRVHASMQDRDGGKLSGQIEVDESFIGGKARNMHRDRREKVIGGGRGVKGKTTVLGILERAQNEKKHSKVKAIVVPGNARKTLQPLINQHVEIGSAVYTDALPTYQNEVMQDRFHHEFIDHALTYAAGAVHTNGLENFWALFKRCIKGTHVNIEPFHTFRYVDAEAFRFNTRKMKDGQRLAEVVKGIAGRRLTYKQLTGEQQSELPPQP